MFSADRFWQSGPGFYFCVFRWQENPLCLRLCLCMPRSHSSIHNISISISTRKWKKFHSLCLCLCLRDTVRRTLAAVVLLLLSKIPSAFYERNFGFYCIQPRVFLLLSNVNIQVRSHFAIFQVLLFLRSTFCFQFPSSEYRTVWRITQHCSICILFAPS